MSRVPRFFAVLSLLLVLIAGCKSQPVRQSSMGCSPSSKDPARPNVCVDTSGGMMVEPRSIRAWNKSPNGFVPAVIWTTLMTRGNLQITMKDEGCVEQLRCNGSGICSAKVAAGLGAGAAPGTVVRTCRYTVTYEGKVLDPEVVIVACCSQ